MNIKVKCPECSSELENRSGNCYKCKRTYGIEGYMKFEQALRREAERKIRGARCLSFVVAVAIIIVFAALSVMAKYNFENNYLYLWNLADKSSTIEAKQEYIEEFSNKLRAGITNEDFSKHNAIFLKTPDNQLENNVRALETLADRLEEIQGMNPNSFEYNTALQQITSQEHGEAGNMIGVIKGCYVLSNYVLVWNWIGGIFITAGLICSVFSLVASIYIASELDSR